MTVQELINRLQNLVASDKQIADLKVVFSLNFDESFEVDALNLALGTAYDKGCQTWQHFESLDQAKQHVTDEISYGGLTENDALEFYLEFGILDNIE